jgi:ribosomal protein L11 methylase PrmA
MPVTFWAIAEPTAMETLKAKGQWLGVRQLRQQPWGGDVLLSARLPETADSPLQVHWLWEQVRPTVKALYAGGGKLAPSSPFLPSAPILPKVQGVFGTAHHPTTRLCLALLDLLPLQNKRVLDIGTGTGILALAATQRGAALVVATDISPTVAQVARFNLAQTSRSRWAVLVGDLAQPLRGTFDLVCCNISAEALLRLLPDLSRLLPDGDLIASGFSGSEWRTVRRGLLAHSIRLLGWQFLNGWLAFLAHSSAKRETTALPSPPL